MFKYPNPLGDNVPKTSEDTSDTRDQLIVAAMRHFSSKGFEAASVRAIVKDAGQNVSAIKYHFGSKESLYDACAKVAAERLSASGPGQIVDAETQPEFPETERDAQDLIRRIISVVLSDALRDQVADEARFLRHEITSGGRSSQVLFDAVLERHLRFLSKVVQIAESFENGDAARARALAIVLQTVLLLSSEEIIKHGLAWSNLKDRIPELVDAIYPLKSNEGSL